MSDAAHIGGAIAFGLLAAGAVYIARRSRGSGQSYAIKKTVTRKTPDFSALFSSLIGMIGQGGGSSSTASTGTGAGTYRVPRGTGDNYTSFKQRMGASESGGDYSVVNSLGYTGRYQFGQGRLDDYMRATGESFTMSQFNADPALQEKVMDWHISDIDKFIYRNGLDQYFGANVAGANLDIDAMRAVAHLGGTGGLKKFVTSGGSYNPADAYGTSLADYAAKFTNI